MSKHSPEIALANARRELDAAREACPHWDCEIDGWHDECCCRVDDARRKLHEIKKRAPTAVLLAL